MKFDKSIIDQKQQSLALKLCRLPCFNQLKVDNISVIDAGLSMPCFHVFYKNKAYFAKSLITNSIEPLASQLAATHGIAPKPIYVGQHWLITEFIAGEGLDNGYQSEEEKLAITIALLARCHSIPNHINHQNLTQTISLIDDQVSEQPYIPNLDISAIISQILQNIDLSSVQKHVLKSLINVLQQNLANTNKIVQNTKQVFCHGDANFSNVIQLKNDTKSTEHSYQLIDFECACIAPIEYDLAMFMAVNHIDSSKIEMINLCYQNEKIAFNQHEKSTNIVDNIAVNTSYNAGPSPMLVTCYLDLSLLINSLWYFSQYQGRKLKKYKTLAVKQLMLLAIRHPQANMLLDEMR